MKKLLIILGPTATGKTDLALALAKKFRGELVACDSRQVYKGLDIGTGKLPGGSWRIEDGRWKKGKGWWEIDGVKIWMYDVVDPKIQYTVIDYNKDANRVIREIRERRKLPIIVGGTGFYLEALLEGIPNLAVPVDKKLRRKLGKLTLLELQNKLQELSPTRWKKLNQSDRQNSRRLLRSIEVISMNPYMNTGKKIRVTSNKFDILKVGLTASREVLYKNADLRVLTWIDQGMISEAKNLQETGLGLNRMRQLGLEYGVLADFLDGKIEEVEQLVKIMRGKVHGYIRRQQTWFKKEKNVHWFDITSKAFPENVEKIVSKWYASN